MPMGDGRIRGVLGRGDDLRNVGILGCGFA
jgi:hypothetical protein